MTIYNKIKYITILSLLAFLPFNLAFADYSTDLTGSGSCTADSEYNGGYVCGNAFDNNLATNWSSTVTAFPHWIKYDFGNGISYAITKITVKHLIDESNHPKDFLFEGSNDNSTFNTVYTGSFADNDSVQTFTFANSVSYRYYRIYISNNYSGGTATNFYEVEMMNTIETATSSATSTPDQYQNNLFYGSFLFLLSFIGTLWIIRSH